MLFENHIDRVIEPCPTSCACPPNRSHDSTPIGSRFGQDIDSIVERDNHHTIGRLQLINKSNGRVLDIFESEMRGAARINQHHHGEGLIYGSKISDLLLDSFFKNSKVAAPKIWYIPTIAIHYRHRHCYQGSIDSHDVAFHSFTGRIRA